MEGNLPGQRLVRGLNANLGHRGAWLGGITSFKYNQRQVSSWDEPLPFVDVGDEITALNIESDRLTVTVRGPLFWWPWHRTLRWHLLHFRWLLLRRRGIIVRTS